jgi:hypothetical protein
MGISLGLRTVNAVGRPIVRRFWARARRRTVESGIIARGEFNDNTANFLLAICELLEFCPEDG